ncbi:MAG: putative PLP-dependent enzyme involved in cell wall biosis [Ilumatobacteraceae bacterium]|nr:putative PLP-dependent enzyme involved in cell wall biosis [Ilumatobacteraceae bacterium]
MVPVVDLSRRGQRFATRFSEITRDIATSGKILLGEHTEAFEAELGAWTGARHVCAVSSGASAIQLALAAIGVGPGDEVILPSFTAVPTAAAVCALGAVPVLIDVDPATACLRGDDIADHRTPRTRAVIVVHLYGYPAPLPITDLPVVEDAAQAHGALDDPGRSAATIYSFYPTKILGGIGDGGAVVTNDPALDALVRRLRVHGMTDQQYRHDLISQNFRMSEIEAAWLRLGLVELDADIAARRGIATALRAAAPQLTWQADDPRHAHHLCVMRTADRDAARRSLADHGVATSVHYPFAVHQQVAYAHFVRSPCPESERWAAQCVSVPCFPEMTAAELDTVCGALAGLAEAVASR